MSYEGWSIERLEHEQTKLHGQAKEIIAKRREVAALLDAARSLAEAERKIAALSDPEKARLLQVLQAEGIGSDEDVSAPGIG
jgi:cob(I)alamin adenosyltransferase